MKKIGIITILVLFVFANCSILTIRPTKTGQILDTDIFAIKNSHVSVYFFRTDNGYIMIDAGINAKKLEKSLQEIAINANDVKLIFLTHSDRDHVNGLTLFQNATIYMSEDELPLANGTINRNRRRTNAMPEGIDINDIILLSNGQIITFGETTIEPIKAPGHTPGSMLYLINERYLFTGDAFRINKNKIMVGAFTMDKEVAGKTVEQLNDRINNSSIVLPSHYRFRVN